MILSGSAWPSSDRRGHGRLCSDVTNVHRSSQFQAADAYIVLRVSVCFCVLQVGNALRMNGTVIMYGAMSGLTSTF